MKLTQICPLTYARNLRLAHATLTRGTTLFEERDAWAHRMGFNLTGRANCVCPSLLPRMLK